MSLARRTAIARRPPERPARPDRSGDYGPGFEARPQRVAAGSGLLALVRALPELAEPDDGPSDAAGGRYMAMVATLSCRLCLRLGFGPSASEVHHLRTGTGGGRRASDFLTMALCPTCHRGPQGLHGDKSLLRMAGVDELVLLSDTIAGLAEA